MTLPGWEHLWFVFYLWLYTMLLVAGAVLIRAPLKARLAAAFALARHRPAAALAAARLSGAGARRYHLHDRRDARPVQRLAERRHLSALLPVRLRPGRDRRALAGDRAGLETGLALALASYVVLVAVETAYPADAHPPHLVMALDRAALAAMLWGMALVMLRLADTCSTATIAGARR